LLHILVPEQHPFALHPGDVVTLGRADDAGIRLPTSDRTVSRYHAQLSWKQSQLIITNTSKNKLLVNGEIAERTVLHHGDIFQIGTHECTVIDPSRTSTERTSAEKTDVDP